MIQKFLKYYRFVLLVSILVMKYRVLIWVLSDRALIRYLINHFGNLRGRNYLKVSILKKNTLIKKVHSVFNRLYPNARCLVHSLVLNEILIRFGYVEEKIKFGAKYEEGKFLAHAWINYSNGFKLLNKL